MQSLKKWVRTQEVCEYLSLSKTTLWRLISSGDFPKPTKINKMSFWDLEAVEAFMLSRSEGVKMYKESHLLVLKALKQGDKDITALNQGSYKTTRISNIIIELKKWGVMINSIKEKTLSGKWFVRYELTPISKNYKKVDSLIEWIEEINKPQAADKKKGVIL